VSLLAPFLIFLFVIPSRLVLGPLGAAGTPAALVGIGIFLLWVVTTMIPARHGTMPSPQPIRVALFIFAAAVVAAYISGMTRIDIGSTEVNAADRYILSLMGWLGVALCAAEAVPTLERLDVLLRRMVLGATFLASVGIIEFVTGKDIAAYIKVPGLHASTQVVAVISRDEFNRPAGTAIHPIEFGVVLAMCFPLALHYAFRKGPGRSRIAWISVLVIGIAMPMSVSRSAVVGLIVAALVLVPTWPRERKIQAAVMVPIFAVALRIAVPGLLGTIRNLFTSFSSDTSTTSRTGAFSAVGSMVMHAPLFGRGPGTFDPQTYRFTDDQYLLTTIETGFVGLVALVLLFAIAFFTARGARRMLATESKYRDLAQSLAASIAVAAVSWGTFDAFSFPMATGVMFVLVGCCGALRRLVLEQPAAAEAAVTDRHVAELFV
jgi:O-antigen ligase